MFRIIITSCLALLLLTITTRAQEQPFSGPPVSEIKISGAIVTIINNGDFVHPTFSPDGKVLAYSNVLLKRDFENTEVFLHDLSTNRRSILLNSRKAATYATYKAYVSEMKWTSAKRLEVRISDGDVDATLLIFDPQRRRLLKEQFEGGDELNPRDFDSIEVKHVSSSRVIFLVRTHSTSERGDNPLFIFDGTQVLRIKEYAELYDAAVDPAGRRIAYCYWAGDKRHIAVKELN